MIVLLLRRNAAFICRLPARYAGDETEGVRFVSDVEKIVVCCNGIREFATRLAISYLWQL